MGSLVPIVIPSYEPDERLIDLLEELDEKNIAPVVLLNDGSDSSYDEIFDRAKEIISKKGGVYLEHEVNMGKGKGLKDAFSYILTNMPEAIGCVTADSDGQHTPDCIRAIVDKLIKCPNKLILGVRDFDDPGVPRKSRLGNKITVKVFKFFTGLSISDTQTGLRGISRDFMKDLLKTKGDRFEYETRMLIETKDKVGIEEVTIETVYDSKENHTTHFNPVKDSIRIYKIFGAMFLRFMFSSLSSSVVDILLFALFCKLNAGIYPGEWDVFASGVEARIISATYNFLVNYVFVFKSKERKRSAVLKYVLLAICQGLTSAGIVTGLVVLTSEAFEVVIKIIVDVTLFFLSYYIQREFVYRSRKKK